MNAVAELVSSLHVPDHKRVACPECSYERKKYNETDLDIIAQADGWKYHCHHCKIGGFVPFYKTNYRKAESNVIPLRTIDTSKLETQTDPVILGMTVLGKIRQIIFSTSI